MVTRDTEDQALVLTGIVSFGSTLGCEVRDDSFFGTKRDFTYKYKVGYPNGFTSVQFFMEWILFEIS